MSKLSWVALIVAAALLVTAIVLETRLAAGAGAALLIVAILYGWMRNRGASDANYARAERGARRVQAEVERDQTPV